MQVLLKIIDFFENILQKKEETEILKKNGNIFKKFQTFIIILLTLNYFCLYKISFFPHFPIFYFSRYTDLIPNIKHNIFGDGSLECPLLSLSCPVLDKFILY